MINGVKQRGFALPSILIASVVMFAVLIVALTSVVVIRTALDSQYHNSLASVAAESGIAKARQCLRASGGVVTWSNASPLRPETNCAGGVVVNCNSTPLSARCGVVVSSGMVTTFSVGEPTYSDGKVDVITAASKLSLLRTSNGDVWYQYASEMRVSADMLLQGDWTIDGKIVAGHSHTCAVVNGKLWCWGSNSFGQLGSSGGGTSTPRPVNETTGLAGRQITDLSADGHSVGSGAGATCVVASGVGFCWGKNDVGHLGIGSTVDTAEPTPLATSGTPMQGATVTRIAMGGSSACAVANNRPYCWGALDASWPNSSVPVLADPSNVLLGRTITDIAVSGRGDSTFCVVASGQLYCRNNTSGALTLATGGLVGKTVTKTSINRSYICAITTEKYLYCGTTVTNLALMGGALAGKSVTDVSVGGFGHSRCAIADGSVYCWGLSAELLGNGPNAPASSTPVAAGTAGIPAGKRFLSVVSEYAHVCTLSDEGVAYCWDRGVNRDGQVGNGTKPVETAVPIEVVNPNPASTRPGFFF